MGTSTTTDGPGTYRKDRGTRAAGRAQPRSVFMSVRRRLILRTTAHLARRSACAAALAVLAAGVASAPALAAGTGAATLAAADSTGFDGFGQSAALSGNGDVAVVGSPDHGASGAGAAYIFTDDGQGFTQSAELTPPGTDSSELLGTSAAISADGQTVVAGAPGDGNDTGAAFVFTDQSGAWTQTAKLVGAGASVNDQEGDSVAMSADASTIVVTAPFSNGEGGAAYVFTKSGSTYAEVQKLTTAGPPPRSGNRRRRPPPTCSDSPPPSPPTAPPSCSALPAPTAPPAPRTCSPGPAAPGRRQPS